MKFHLCDCYSRLPLLRTLILPYVHLGLLWWLLNVLVKYRISSNYSRVSIYSWVKCVTQINYSWVSNYSRGSPRKTFEHALYYVKLRNLLQSGPGFVIMYCMPRQTRRCSNVEGIKHDSSTMHTETFCVLRLDVASKNVNVSVLWPPNAAVWMWSRSRS